MSDLVPVGRADLPATPAAASLGTDVPDLESLFVFARDAERRLSSLRMTVHERSVNARGEDFRRHDLLLRHPRRARLTTSRDDDPLSSDYDLWIVDGDEVRTFAASHRVASVRTRPPRLAGSDDRRLPPAARTHAPLTPLPAGSVVDTFVHPHGLFRNVLVTGPVAVVGTRLVADREAIVVRAEHPRSAKVLMDRPDRVVEVSIDRSIGLLLSLTETIAGRVTQHAEVTALELDADIPDAAFASYLGSDVRMLY